MLATNSYEWVLEADIEACFDSLSHSATLVRVSRRIADKRVMALIKAFLQAGIMTELGGHEETLAGTPQGGILSPLIANVAAVRAGRALRPDVADDDGDTASAREDQTPRGRYIPAVALRGRLRRVRRRAP